MKNLFFIALLFFVASTEVMAQEQTLFNRSRSAGFFVSPLLEFSSFDDGEVRGSSGLGIALVVDDFFIGGYGLAAVDIDALIEDQSERVEIDLAHTGLWLGYTYPSRSLAHLFTSVKGGWGLVNTSFDALGIERADRVFVLTPEVGVEINLFRWLRLAATGGYRVVNGVTPDISGISNSDLNGFTGGLTLRIGSFGRSWRNCD